MVSAIGRVPAWFERKFDFTFPAELLPNICIRLRGAPARLEEMLGNVPRRSVVKQRKGKWSIQENAGHLADLENLWRARVRDYLGASTELTSADLQNRKTDEAHHNSRPLATILQTFRNERAALLGEVETAEPIAFSRTLLHPRLQLRMRLVDHLFFVAEHDDHHMAMIWALLGPVAKW